MPEINPLRFLDGKDMGQNAVIPAPKVCIVLLTYLRTDMAIATIRGIIENLDYPQEDRIWYIADDGSPVEHMRAMKAALDEGGESVYQAHNEKLSPGTPFCGAGWNWALEKAHQVADTLLWLEDDWVLKEKLDIRPYVRVLLEREDVGIIRLGHLTVGSQLEIVGYHGIHYFKYLRTTKFAYSGNPHLRHLRHVRYYGHFATDRTPGDLEIEHDERFRESANGPDIWRPAAIREWGVFGHIGRERTW